MPTDALCPRLEGHPLTRDTQTTEWNNDYTPKTSSILSNTPLHNTTFPRHQQQLLWWRRKTARRQRCKSFTNDCLHTTFSCVTRTTNKCRPFTNAFCVRRCNYKQPQLESEHQTQLVRGAKQRSSTQRRTTRHRKAHETPSVRMMPLLIL